MVPRTSTPPLRILALDPAAACGWAHSCGESGVWELQQRGDRHPGRKLTRLAGLMVGVADRLGVDIVAYESAEAFSRGMAAVARAGEYRGVILYAAAKFKAEVLTVAPRELKKWATGSGNAGKDQMRAALLRLHGLDLADHNQADAVWVLEFAKLHFARRLPRPGVDVCPF